MIKIKNSNILYTADIIFALIVLYIFFKIIEVIIKKFYNIIKNKRKNIHYKKIYNNLDKNINKYKKTYNYNNNYKTEITKKEIYPFSNFSKNTSLLTKTELNFYNTLKLCIEQNEIICTKVRIADFVTVKQNKIYYENFNKISRKHIDFLICNEKFETLYAIELDDPSHEHQTERDMFVNELYRSINLPILRIKTSNSYNTDTIKELIKTKLNAAKLIEQLEKI